MTIHWIDGQGAILDVTRDDGDPVDGDGNPIVGAVQIKSPPNPVATNRGQVWDFATKQWGPAPPPVLDPLTAEELEAHLIVIGVINQDEIDAIKVRR